MKNQDIILKKNQSSLYLILRLVFLLWTTIISDYGILNRDDYLLCTAILAGNFAKSNNLFSSSKMANTFEHIIDFSGLRFNYVYYSCSFLLRSIKDFWFYVEYYVLKCPFSSLFIWISS